MSTNIQFIISNITQIILSRPHIIWADHILFWADLSIHFGQTTQFMIGGSQNLF